MAFTPEQLQALDDAIASGELTVSVNGRTVTYRSIRDLMLARDAVARAMQQPGSAGTTSGSARHRLASFGAQD